MQPAVIIMSRVPLPGKTKTRLMADLSPEECAAFHQACLIDIGQTIDELNISGYLYYTGGTTEDFKSDELNMLLPESKGLIEKVCRQVTLKEQKGIDLGQRLYNAADEILKDHNKVIFIGSDLPYLSSEQLYQALEVLENNDLVLGPAKDGGYYLIGMKKPYSSLFADIPWGGEEVLQRTLEKIKDQSLIYYLMDEKFDIDTWKNLICYYEKAIEKGLKENWDLYSLRLAEKIIKANQ